MLQMIANALAAGHGVKEILNFLSKKISGLDKSINEARSIGYADNDILNFLSGKMKVRKTPQQEKQLTAQERYLKNAGVRTKEEKSESLRKGLNTTLGVGAIALAGYGLYNKYSSKLPKTEILTGPFEDEALPNVGKQIEGQVKPQLDWQPGKEVGQPGPGQFQMVPESEVMPTPQPVVPDTTGGSSSQPITQPVVNPEQILNQFGSLEKAKALLKAGNDPANIPGILIATATPQLKKAMEGQREQLQQAVLALTQQQMPQAVAQKGISNAQQAGQVEEQQNDAQEVLEREAAKLQQPSPGQEKQTQGQIGNIVTLPDGKTGIIEKDTGDHLVINQDGKLKPVKKDQVEDLGLNEKDLADLYDDLLRGVEKTTGQEVSRNVDWAGYDPGARQLAYRPHGASLYIYDDIDEPTAKELTELLTQRRTSGQNFIGAWAKGTSSPIGSRMYDLITRLQKERGGKGKEYSKKFQTLYHSIGAAVEAKKQKVKDEAKKQREKKPRKGKK